MAIRVLEALPEKLGLFFWATPDYWEKCKQITRYKSLLKDAEKSLKKAAMIGFDWPNLQGLVNQIHEEVQEVCDEHEKPIIDRKLLLEECGDLILAVIDLCRKLEIDAEEALKVGLKKFDKRMEAMLELSKTKTSNFSSLSIDEMLELWREVKTNGVL